MTPPSPGINSELTELSTDYEILGELGRGGSAVVYHGRDRSLGRDVAIKVVHPRALSAQDDPVARLQREARTVAQLQHPSIVTVFAVRRLTGGGLALVMQYVPGRTLKAMVLEEGAMSPERARQVLQDVAAALAYAHSRGVIHRDVKPENIFLDSETGRALLSDFGIARSDEQDSVTMTGTAIGTPFYMSPEQIDGTAIDGRSDLYSLGLVAWEMLTGQRPWDGESLYNVISKQKHEQLPPIEAIRSGVPQRLQYIIERMLQKNPAARWAGAEGLLAQLTHSVLPGDYGRWQAALAKRVERYRLAERERAKAVIEGPPRPSGLLASTMRFVRGVGGADRTKEPALQEPIALGDTMVVPRGGLAKPPAATRRLNERTPSPSPAEARSAASSAGSPTVAAPTWDLPSAGLPRSAWIGGAVGLLLFAAGATAFRLHQTGALPSLDSLLSGEPRAEPRSAPAPPTASIDAPADAAAPSTAATSSLVREGTDPQRAVLALGGRHSCAVTGAGVVNCWGGNDRGQLGDGTAAQQIMPVRVAAELSFSSIAAGSAQSCGVTSTGDLYCWGSDTNGQLGDATTIRRNAPVRVAGPGIYRAVSSGDAHTCAVTVQGSVDCWGLNARGQLGDGTTTQRVQPGRILGVDAVRFTQVVVGGSHTCALASTGAVYCWGANDRGQLGIGASGDRAVPTVVAGPVRFTSLSAGLAHTCGITATGTVSCWGSNTRGQLGNGTRDNATTPQAVRIAVGGTAVAAGGLHSCVLTPKGEAFCWGANAAGQLGSGTLADASVPVRVATDETLQALAAGGAHSCAATRLGGLLCWGDNSSGQIGDATRVSRSLPTRSGVAAPTPAAPTTAAPSTSPVP